VVPTHSRWIPTYGCTKEIAAECGIDWPIYPSVVLDQGGFPWVPRNHLRQPQTTSRNCENKSSSVPMNSTKHAAAKTATTSRTGSRRKERYCKEKHFSRQPELFDLLNVQPRQEESELSVMGSKRYAKENLITETDLLLWRGSVENRRPLKGIGLAQVASRLGLRPDSAG